MFTKKTIVLLVLFSINCLVYSNNNTIFASWIERTCKPFDKGKLTAFPRFNIVSKNINMSAMLRFEDLPKVNSERWLSLEDLEGEVWKPVVGYENEYKVSNYGRIYSYSRNGLNKNTILSIRTSGKYWRVGLRKNGKRSYFSVHRIVAAAFLKNPKNLPQIDHINCNRNDNRACNLRFVTAKENMNNPITKERHLLAMSLLKENKHSKKVVQLTKDGFVVNVFCSLKEAQRKTGVHKSNISAAARNKKKWVKDHWATVQTAGGYMWKFL